MNKKQYEMLHEEIGKSILISIGINHYTHKGKFENLSKCINDANKMFQVFQNTSALSLCDSKSRLLISDEERLSTSKEEIIETLKTVSQQADFDEKLFVYFSGHGHVLENENYLVPSNYGTVSEETLISLKEVVEILEGSRAKIKIIMLDACRSGVVNGNMKGFSAYKFDRIKDYIKETKATVVISACGKNEYATEKSPNPELSLFTTYLVNAFEGVMAALDNGYLTIDSLYHYVSDEMNKISRQDMDINQCPNLNVKSNRDAVAVLGLYKYEIKSDYDDDDNFYKINTAYSRKKQTPYDEIAEKGKIYLTEKLWRDTQMLLNELILNIKNYADAPTCFLQFSNNRIVLIDDGVEFNPIDEFTQDASITNGRGHGNYLYQKYCDKYAKEVVFSYSRIDNCNNLTLNFIGIRAFNIKGLCKIIINYRWLSFTKDDIILPQGKCKKYYYYVEEKSPCISMRFNLIRTLLEIIPTESQLVVIDKDEEFIELARENYIPNPRIIYRNR